MHLRRQSLTNTQDAPSIDPVTNSGRGTAQRVDGNGLQADRRNVIAVAKGRRIDGAPISEEKTDLVQMGRAQVLARSGNDAGQHEEEWEGDGGNFDELAAGDVSPAMKTTHVLTVAVVAAILWWAWKK
jgi:hypothetical protein